MPRQKTLTQTRQKIDTKQFVFVFLGIALIGGGIAAFGLLPLKGTIVGKLTNRINKNTNTAPIAKPVYTGNYDGKNGDDLAKFDTKSLWKIKFSTGTESLFDSSSVSLNFGNAGAKQKPITADFNNDAFVDLAMYYQDTGKWDIRLADPQNPEYFASVQSISFGTPKTASLPFVGDFNGDKRTDIGVFSPDSSGKYKWEFKFSTGNDIQTAFASNPFSIFFGTTYYSSEPLTGDINGDAKDDIILFIRDNDVTCEAFNTKFASIDQSNGNYFSDDVFSQKCGGSYNDFTPYIGDFDGDKKDDLALYARDTATPNIYIWFSDSSGSDGAFTTGISEVLGWSFQPTQTEFIGDFNNDAKIDLGVWSEVDGMNYYLKLATGSRIDPFGDYIEVPDTN